MNIASIDIGSNTVLLLITQTENKKIVKILDQQYLSPRLGDGLIPGGNIRDESIDKLMDALEKFRESIIAFECQKVLVNATNAMRIAANGGKISEQINQHFGWDINIISGETEAGYSYLGASSVMEVQGKKVVIDIGGGSTEIIIGTGKNIEFRKSFPVGTVSFTQKYLASNPPSINEIKELDNELIEAFAELKQFKCKLKGGIAVAGTPTTLSCINQNEHDYSENIVEGSILSLKSMENIYNKLSPLTPKEIREKFGNVVEGRQDVIFCGNQILKTITNLLDLDQITVSAKGLRFGAVIEYLNKN